MAPLISLGLFFNDSATSEIYTLSLHDALPISLWVFFVLSADEAQRTRLAIRRERPARSEEHTSELQSRGHLVCRLLLEKKNDDSQMNAAHQPLGPNTI